MRKHYQVGQRKEPCYIGKVSQIEVIVHHRIMPALSISNPSFRARLREVTESETSTEREQENDSGRPRSGERSSLIPPTFSTEMRRIAL